MVGPPLETGRAGAFTGFFLITLFEQSKTSLIQFLNTREFHREVQ